MPERQVGAAVPFLVLIASAGLFGVVAQIGVTLALGLARSRAQFLGFVLLSLVMSGSASVLFTRVMHMEPEVGAALGALLGAVPSLITLRVGIRLVAKQHGVDATDELKQLEAKPNDK